MEGFCEVPCGHQEVWVNQRGMHGGSDVTGGGETAGINWLHTQSFSSFYLPGAEQFNQAIYAEGRL